MAASAFATADVTCATATSQPDGGTGNGTVTVAVATAAQCEHQRTCQLVPSRLLSGSLRPRLLLHWQLSIMHAQHAARVSRPGPG